MNTYQSEFFPVLKRALEETQLPEEVYLYVINYVTAAGALSDYHLMCRANAVIRRYLLPADTQASLALEDGIAVSDWYQNYRRFVATVLRTRVVRDKVVPA